MSSNIHATTDSTDRNECPECGSDVYYEPMLRGGTRHEFNAGDCSGYACTECTWHEAPTRHSVEETDTCTDCGDPTPEAELVANAGRHDECKREYERTRFVEEYTSPK